MASPSGANISSNYLDMDVQQPCTEAIDAANHAMTNGQGAALRPQQPQQQQSDFKYLLVKEIGFGTYSKVLVGHGPDGQVALKQIRVSKRTGLPYSTMRELTVLKHVSRLRHPNIVTLIDVLLQRHEDCYYLFLVFELMHCDLYGFLNSQPMAPATFRNLGYQLLLGVDFLHRHRIVHRDLKPQNCLINKQGTVLKIADFNMSRVCSWERQMTSVVSTLWYRSPEVLLCCGYASPTDVWSAGCILFEMASGQPLFDAQQEAPMLRQIFAFLGLPSATAWPKNAAVARQPLVNKYPAELSGPVVAASLARRLKSGPVSGPLGGCGYTGGRWSLASLLGERLLRFLPSSRCTAAEAMRHPYFAMAAAGSSATDSAATVDAQADELVESVVRNAGINSPCPLPPRQTLFPEPRRLAPGRASMPARANAGALSSCGAPFASFRQKRPASLMLEEDDDDDDNDDENGNGDNVDQGAEDSAASAAAAEDHAVWGVDEELEEFSSSNENESQSGSGFSLCSSNAQLDSSFNPSVARTPQLVRQKNPGSENHPPLPAVVGDVNLYSGKAPPPLPPPTQQAMPLRQNQHVRRSSL